VAAGFGRHGMPPPAANDRYSIGSRQLRLVTWPWDLDLCPWRSWRLWLMRVVVLHPSTKFEVRRPALPFGRYGAQCVWALMGLVTLTIDLLTLKLVCESHQRWGNFVQNIGTLSLRVLQLFAMYATDGRTDGRTKANTVPFLRAGA